MTTRLARRSLRLTLAAGLLAAGAMVAMPAPASACPNCRELVADNSTGGGTADAGGLSRGIYWSVLFMMATPFVLLGSVGTGIWYTSTHQRPQK